jgi:hypothetical protein
VTKVCVRDPVVIEPRRMSQARRQRIIARDKHCRHPGCEVTEGLEVDHILCLEIGGSDADHNLQALCFEHHKLKTRNDIAIIAKAKRRQAKHEGREPPPTQPLRSRNTFKRRWG